MLSNTERRADKSLYNDSPHDFIPVVCYYDSNTLLTKNGNLVQTIEITGIESEVISDKLGSLRSSIKESLKKRIMTPDIACWIHTIRHETDLDDHIPYNNVFASDLHDIWVTKNSLRKRFVNTLYISIVSSIKNFHLSNLDNIIDASFLDAISVMHDNHLEKSSKHLSDVVAGVMDDLKDYLPKQLSIGFNEDKCLADLLYLYKHIASLRGSVVDIPLKDFSLAIAPEHYAFGGNSIEVLDNDNKKFASIISIKEYINDNKDDLLEEMLHVSLEFIATEILFAMDSKASKKTYEHQNFILGVSKDEELRKAKMLDSLFDESYSGHVMQQLSIMIISDDIEKLENNTKTVSKKISQTGLVNVREDINLENIFWSQMPGNFKFMRRHNANIIDSTCAFVSIQNTPTGQRKSKWGSSVATIATDSNTPYFINFHNSYQTGHTCIYGNANMGKSVLMNFLISEAMKFNPTVLYLSVDNSSNLLIKALGGEWYSDCKIPVLENKTNVIVGMMVDIMSGQYSGMCNDEERKHAKLLLNSINSVDSYAKAIEVVKKYQFPESCVRLRDNIYSIIEHLDANNVTVKNGSITGINLGTLGNVEKKDLRSAFVIASLRSLCFDKTTPKILVIDEMTHLFDHPYYTNYMSFVLNLAKTYNIAIIGTVDSDDYVNNTSQAKLWSTLLQNLDLQIVMRHKDHQYDLKKVFGLTEHEEKQLLEVSDSKRFVIKPSGAASTIGQLSISSIAHVMKILSCSEQDIEVYNNIVAKVGNEPAKFLPELYKALKEKK